MYRLAVEFPLFYGNEREDVREFIDNYSRAGRLNGWDEEKLAFGLPLFLKKHASLWFKTLSGSENFTFEVLSQKLISHFESKVTLWQLRQKLEERRQLLGETVADYYYDILSFCSRLNLPKSEWLYCFVRGLRPEIREHVILQQPPDLESALNIAKLKELVTLSRKTKMVIRHMYLCFLLKVKSFMRSLQVKIYLGKSVKKKLKKMNSWRLTLKMKEIWK